jgi:hypothetical protein
MRRPSAREAKRPYSMTVGARCCSFAEPDCDDFCRVVAVAGPHRASGVSGVSRWHAGREVLVSALAADDLAAMLTAGHLAAADRLSGLGLGGDADSGDVVDVGHPEGFGAEVDEAVVRTSGSARINDCANEGAGVTAARGADIAARVLQQCPAVTA